MVTRKRPRVRPSEWHSAHCLAKTGRTRDSKKSSGDCAATGVAVAATAVAKDATSVTKSFMAVRRPRRREASAGIGSRYGKIACFDRTLSSYEKLVFPASS